MVAPRHIFILLDGTSCSAAGGFARDFSNVFRHGWALTGKQDGALARQPDRGEGEQKSSKEEQIVLYFPGPATRKVPFRRWNEWSGSETNEIVREAYLALCNNITDSVNDKIYIIGYSRGAAAAKILIALIAECGLLGRENLHQFGNLWSAFYRNRHKRRFFGRAARPINISFVGLYDPVSGPQIGKTAYKISEDIDHNVESAVEILAMDERRRVFFPRLWRLPELSADDVVAQPFPQKPRLQQIWLPGGHGDIGHPEDGNIISNIAFLTMLERISTLTSIKLNTDLVSKTFKEIVHRIDSLKVNFKGPRVIWKKRILPLTRVTEIHPLYYLFENRRITINRRKRKYKEITFPRCDRFKTYSFDIDYIVGERDCADKIDEAYFDSMSQNA